MPVRTRGLRLLIATAAMLSACGPHRPPAGGAQTSAGLTIDNAALRQWRFLYARVADVEWMACLYGRVETSGIHVERSELADVSSADFAAVAGRCPDRSDTELIGLAHSHPRRPDGRPSCMPSSTDTRDLGRPWKLVIVVCDTAAGAITIGYRADGRHPVVRRFTAPDVLPPLVLGEDRPGSRR